MNSLYFVNIFFNRVALCNRGFVEHQVSIDVNRGRGWILKLLFNLSLEMNVMKIKKGKKYNQIVIIMSKKKRWKIYKWLNITTANNSIYF